MQAIMAAREFMPAFVQDNIFLEGNEAIDCSLGADHLSRICRRRARAGKARQSRQGRQASATSPGLYADIGGPGSVVAAQMAAGRSTLISADHQNKPDVGVNIGKQWIDVEKVDAFVDLASSGVGLAIANLAKEKNVVNLNSGSAVVRPHRRAMFAEYGALGLRHLHARQRHRQGAGQVRWRLPGSS